MTYYKKRINIEVFHVLADGAGAIEFLKFVLAAYFNILYPGTLPLDDPLIHNQIAIEELDSDAFEEYYTGGKDPRSKKKSRVWLLRSKRRPDLDLNVTEGIMSCPADPGSVSPVSCHYDGISGSGIYPFSCPADVRQRTAKIHCDRYSH